MRADKPLSILRSNYTAPDFLVEQVEIGFDLDPSESRIATRLSMMRNPATSGRDIVLHGDGPELVQLRMNGLVLGKRAYKLDHAGLRIFDAPDNVLLELETLVHPAENTSLSGLYVSGENFFTQCEAEGFRRITFFPDRPDVMAKYTVMLRADKKKYPVLLSNGNLLEQGDLGDGRHYAKWEDPFKKPSYLFALVAARLVCQEEEFLLKSGRKVLLQIWVEAGNLDKTAYAMESLKNSIRWDEERFGLELDLDRFMIVAVGDFNMGAMENKGLNIFNTKCVLANPRISTDVDHANIEAIVGHEYFHNWTGNRVTCRDWFQLSLKEGLTVFRDQEFSADMIGSESGRAVNRIEIVRGLRQTQFPEDAGPMAHPIRPDSFVEINNFYTSTVYDKGAEVVRMYQTLVGRDGFRKGMDLYFQRHDGQAVECDDFRAAMADANGRDLKQFERWYSQSGTPLVKARSRYDAATSTFEISFTQSCRATPGQEKKRSFHIPVAIGLVGSDGKDMPLFPEQAKASGKTSATPPDSQAGATTMVLELTKARQTFRFTQVSECPTPSILRNFSAPVELQYAYSEQELMHLFIHDSDPFNRWEAGQRLAMGRLLKLTHAVGNGNVLELDQPFIEAMRSALNNQALTPAFRELALTLPSESVIAEQLDVVDPQAIRTARQFMRTTLARAILPDLLNAYESNATPGVYRPDAVSAGRRALKNLALSYLLESPDATICQLAQAQLADADNMSDREGALKALINATSSPLTTKIAARSLQQFYKDFKDEPLVIDKWFTFQAMALTSDVAKMRELMLHPAFTLKNPNRARSLIMSFCSGNPSQFHAADGSGYEFWAEQVIALNAINPQVAARVARSLDRWRKYAPPLQEKMKQALQQVAKAKSLSKDVLEIITKSLAE